MQRILRMLTLFPVMAGMLLADAQISFGCSDESGTREASIQAACHHQPGAVPEETNREAQPQPQASCCQSAQSKTPEPQPKSCCSEDTTEGSDAPKLSCCCTDVNKTSCGCRCRQPGEERLPANSSPPQTSLGKVAAVGSVSAVAEELGLAAANPAIGTNGATSGTTFSILYCCWRN